MSTRPHDLCSLLHVVLWIAFMQCVLVVLGHMLVSFVSGLPLAHTMSLGGVVALGVALGSALRLAISYDPDNLDPRRARNMIIATAMEGVAIAALYAHQIHHWIDIGALDWLTRIVA